MTDKEIIGEGWRSYAEDVLHPSAPDIQRKECRNAFYAGAAFLYGTIIKLTENAEAEPVDSEVEAINIIEFELAEYPLKVLKGKN